MHYYFFSAREIRNRVSVCGKGQMQVSNFASKHQMTMNISGKETSPTWEANSLGSQISLWVPADILQPRWDKFQGMSGRGCATGSDAYFHS